MAEGWSGGPDVRIQQYGVQFQGRRRATELRVPNSRKTCTVRTSVGPARRVHMRSMGMGYGYGHQAELYHTGAKLKEDVHRMHTHFSWPCSPCAYAYQVRVRAPGRTWPPTPNLGNGNGHGALVTFSETQLGGRGCEYIADARERGGHGYPF